MYAVGACDMADVRSGGCAVGELLYVKLRSTSSNRTVRFSSFG